VTWVQRGTLERTGGGGFTESWSAVEGDDPGAIVLAEARHGARDAAVSGDHGPGPWAVQIGGGPEGITDPQLEQRDVERLQDQVEAEDQASPGTEPLQ
jgi:hypothetical protein